TVNHSGGILRSFNLMNGSVSRSLNFSRSILPSIAILQSSVKLSGNWMLNPASISSENNNLPNRPSVQDTLLSKNVINALTPMSFSEKPGTSSKLLTDWIEKSSNC